VASSASTAAAPMAPDHEMPACTCALRVPAAPALGRASTSHSAPARAPTMSAPLGTDPAPNVLMASRRSRGALVSPAGTRISLVAGGREEGCPLRVDWTRASGRDPARHGGRSRRGCAGGTPRRLPPPLSRRRRAGADSCAARRGTGRRGRDQGAGRQQVERWRPATHSTSRGLLGRAGPGDARSSWCRSGASSSGSDSAPTAPVPGPSARPGTDPQDPGKAARDDESRPRRRHHAGEQPPLVAQRGGEGGAREVDHQEADEADRTGDVEGPRPQRGPTRSKAQHGRDGLDQRDEACARRAVRGTGRTERHAGPPIFGGAASRRSKGPQTDPRSCNACRGPTGIPSWGERLLRGASSSAGDAVDDEVAQTGRHPAAPGPSGSWAQGSGSPHRWASDGSDHVSPRPIRTTLQCGATAATWAVNASRGRSNQSLTQVINGACNVPQCTGRA